MKCEKQELWGHGDEEGQVLKAFRIWLMQPDVWKGNKGLEEEEEEEVLPAINTTTPFIGFYSNYYFHLPFILVSLFHFIAFYVMFCLFVILTYSNWRIFPSAGCVQDRDLLHRIKLFWIIIFNEWCTCLACRPVCFYGTIRDDRGNFILSAFRLTDRSVCRKTLHFWF